jgi:hypothetical protein
MNGWPSGRPRAGASFSRIGLTFPRVLEPLVPCIYPKCSRSFHILVDTLASGSQNPPTCFDAAQLQLHVLEDEESTRAEILDKTLGNHFNDPARQESLRRLQMGVARIKAERRKKATFVKVGFSALVVVGVALAFAFTQEPATGASATVPQSTQQLTRLGTTTIHSTPIGDGAVADPEIDNRPELGDEPGVKPGESGDALIHAFSIPTSSMPPHRANYRIPSKEAARRGAASRSAAAAKPSAFPPPEPNVPASFVVGFQSPGFAGFNGLSHVEQRTANGGNQFSLEPPDQGLCAGNGFVIETVNDVIQVYNTRGLPLSGVEDMNTFFGLPAAIDRTNIIFGPFLSDPRCFYDAQTQRWFVTELMEDNGTNVGATGRNFNLIAVSTTADPTQGFAIFAYDVTDDGLNGTVNHAGCPCFGDQPLFGTDKYGVYQTTNEFGAAVFNGAQIYTISKAQLIAAANSAGPLPLLVHLDASQQLVPFGGESYSIQPATSPRADAWDRDLDGSIKNGAEYFLSALQFVDTFDNRIAVWALTNTRSLNSKAPTLTLSFAVIQSETYGQPNPASQKAGEVPLASAFGESEGLINTNDDRMNQVVFANGILYGGVNSLLKVKGVEQQGIAWFGVRPFFQGPTLKGQVVRQGYIAVQNGDTFFPSLGINSDGNGVIAFTLAGNGYFPNAAYVDVIQGFALPFVHIAGAGQDPNDGFTTYVAEGGNGVGRWGDYSAAVADGDRIWMAAEYIPKACSGLALPCRTSLANWGTFFSTVRPLGF